MVWGISPETPGSGLGALTHAMRHVGTVGRPVGGSGQVPDTLLAAFERAGGTLRDRAARSTRSCATATASVASRLVDGTEITRTDRRVGLQSARHVPALAQAIPRLRPPIWSDRWRNVRHDEGYESKIDAVLSRATGAAELRSTARADDGDRAVARRDRPRRID